MDNKENEFSPQESLRLISSMIETTKNSMSDSSVYFLLWGWGVLVICVAQYCLKVIIKYPNDAIVWLAIPVILIVHIFLVIKKRRKEKVKTFIGEANAYLWTAIGLSFFVLIFIFSKTGWRNCVSVYIIMYAIGTYVSGCLIKFRPLIIGGLICFLLAAIAVFLSDDSQIIMLALAILVSYIIPGHLLRIKYGKQQSHV